MEKNKLMRKALSLFMALVIIFGGAIPNAIPVHAAADLQIAQYVKVTGDTVCGGTETAKTAVYNGQWTASIPMGKVMSSMESDMKTAANNGWYPHGKDGKNKIAYVEYTITFPEGVKIDDSNIDLKNFTSMFNSNGMSKAVNGQKVTLKFKLKDENWAGIYKHYLADGGANSTKTIDITIPYSVQANSLQEAKEIEKKQITARGEFETHASGGFAYSWTKVVKTTDVSTKPLAEGISKSDCFPKPQEVTMTLPLDADLKLGDNTGNDTIVVEKTDTMDFVGVLNVKAIKEQMAQIQGNHQGANPDEISLENLNTTFTAKLNLPKELKFEKTEPVLEGADSVFKIEGITKENDGKTAVVTFKLINAENIKTFAQLRDKINSVNDELKVVFKTAKFDNTANTNIDYEVTGSITGNLTAEATNKATGTIINFNLTWNGKQSDAGKSNSNPDAIALSVRHEGPVVIKDKIYGDLLINDDTQHDKVIELAKRDAFKVTGLLNVAPIKAQMKKIQEQYQNGNLATNLKISDMKNEFTASINLPDGLEFTNNVKEKIVLSGAKNHFKISKTELDEKKLTVTLTLTNEAKTFEDILTAVNGVEDDLKVEVDGVKFTDKSSANTNFTIQGDVSGLFEAKVTNVLSSKVMNFNFAWSGVQMRGGEDSTAPTSDKITATVKHNTNTISAEGELEGDLLVNNDTQHNDVYTVKMNDKMILTGLLNVKPIKEQLDQLVKAYPSANTPENIKVENVDTSFTATMTLPKELKLVDGDKTIIELVGANDKFKITDKKVEGNTVTVKMSLVKKAETFKDIKDAVEGVDNDLRVNVQGVMFDTTKAKPDTNYTINGTVGGNFKAMAINTLGKTIDFDYTWKGVQKKDGEDSTNPNSKDITLTLKYQKPTTQDVKIPTQILPGDILVGDDTEHDKVFETLQGKKVAFTGSLDVSSVKQQMEKIKRMYGKSDQDAEKILISDYSSTFVATLTLPNEMNFDGMPTISLLNDNGKFKIIDTKVEGKTVKVTMTVKKEVTTFEDLQDAVLGMENKLNVVVDGAIFNKDAKPGTNYTVRGTMTGQLKAKATYELSGNVINFDLTWNAEQSEDGADAINPTSKDITFTLKYKANENPQTPNNGENPSKPDTPKNDKIQKKTTNNVKTNDLSNIVLYSGIMIISLLGMVVVLYGRKLFQKR